MPLANEIRPQTLDDMVGQEHLIGEGMLLRKIIESGNIPNMIIYGPPGTGKTTLASVIANVTNRNYIKLNATNCGVKDIRDAVDKSQGKNGMILYLDEIQNLSKKQQQSLLEFIEDGTVTLIASTADNPYFVVYKALLSRSTIFQFNPLNKEDIIKGLKRAFELNKKNQIMEDKAFKYIAEIVEGDLRSAINVLENVMNYSDSEITLESVIKCSPIKILNYDRDGDSHYDILSAFHKSLRGSDCNAAVHYLAKLIKAGDIQNICRRLLCVASEDVGLAYPQAIFVTKACVDSALQLGFPEARIPLAEAAIFLANSPKSNSAISAIDSALSDLDNISIGEIPSYLRDAHYEGAKDLGHIGYKYPHNFDNHYVQQQYLPDAIKGKKYYNPCNNKQEKMFIDYWKNIKK
jgi:putative ATPase